MERIGFSEMIGTTEAARVQFARYGSGCTNTRPSNNLNLKF